MEFSFEQNQTVDSMDKVPDPFKALYGEGEGDSKGKFSLRSDLAQVARSIDGLNKATKTLRGGEKTLKELVDKYRKLGDSPEEVEAKITELNAALSSKEKINPEKIKEEVAKSFKGQIDEKDAKIAKKDKAIHKYLVTSQATAAIAEAKGVPDLLLPHIERQVKVVEDGEDYRVTVVDAQGETRYGSAGNPLTIPELVANMKADKVFGRAFESDAAGGGGKEPGGSQRKITSTAKEAQKSSLSKIASGLQKHNMGGAA